MSQRRRLKQNSLVKLPADERERQLMYLAEVLAATLTAREDDDTPAEPYLPASRSVH